MMLGNRVGTGTEVICIGYIDARGDYSFTDSLLVCKESYALVGRLYKLITRNKYWQPRSHRHTASSEAPQTF